MKDEPMPADVRTVPAPGFAAKLFKDLISLTSGQAFSMALGFIAFTYLARILDPVSYGALEYAIAIAAFFTVVIECGLGPVGVRHLARDRARTPDLAADIPAARSVLAFLAVPLAGLSSYVMGQNAATTSLVWLFALSLFGVPWRQDWLLQGVQKMHQAALGPVVRMLIFALGVFLFVRDAHDVMIVGFINLAAEAICSTYYLAVQHVWVAPFRPRFHLARIAALIREGASLGMGQIVWTFIQYIPLFLVATLIGGEETAWFGAPLRILLALLAFEFLYHFNLYPIVVRALAEDRARWQRLMSVSIKWSTWGAVGAALALALLSSPLMLLVFGSKFTASGPVFAVLIWVLPLRMLADHARWTLVAAGHQKYLLMAELAGASVLLIVGLLLVPGGASLGAAAAAVAGNVATWITAHLLANKHIGRLPGAGLAAVPAASAALAALAGSFAPGGVLVTAAVSMVCFAAFAGIVRLRESA
jgi:O-antigen/teichoic acid export membrane protein